MHLPAPDVALIRQTIENAKKILILSHKSPDGDTVGCATAWYEMITTHLQKSCDLACFDQIPQPLRFVPHTEKYQQDFDLSLYDLVIVSDSGAHYLTGFHETKNGFLQPLPEGGFLKQVPIINVDHHGSNEAYGNINLIITSAASTTMILLEIFQQFDWQITRNAATSLLTGIYTDTGSFMHSNTTPEVYRAASFLMTKGANIRLIRKEIFKTTPLSTLRLWGRVLSNIATNEDGVAMSVLTDDDFTETGADYSELTGVIDYVNSVPNAKFTVMLTERNGKVKGSLRTLNDIDVAEIAGRFGGGGHKKAAGFTVPGRLKKEVRWTIVPEKA